MNKQSLAKRLTKIAADLNNDQQRAVFLDFLQENVHSVTHGTINTKGFNYHMEHNWFPGCMRWKLHEEINNREFYVEIWIDRSTESREKVITVSASSIDSLTYQQAHAFMALFKEVIELAEKLRRFWFSM